MVAGIFRLPAEHLRALIRVSVEFAVIWAFAWFVFKKVDPWLGAFVFLASIMTVFPVFDRFSLLRRDAILMGVGWYILLRLYADRDLIFNGICIVSLVNSLFLLSDWCGIDPYAIVTFGAITSSGLATNTGLMTNPGEASVLAGISVVLFARGRWKWFMPLILLSLIPAESTVGPVCVLAAMTVCLVYRRDKTALIGLLGALIAVWLYAAFWDSNNLLSCQWRIDYNLIGLEIIRDNPFGVGLGHWHLVTKQLHMHNDFLQMVVEMGVISSLIIGGYFITSFYKTDLLGRMALAAIVVASAVSFAWFIPVTGLILVSLMAGINRGAYG